MIVIKNGYLIFSKEIVDKYFFNIDNIYYVYYPDKNEMLLTSIQNELFNKFHKAQSTFLKNKDNLGRKCFQINNILLDNNLDECDRELEFVENDKKKVLKIKL